MSTDTITQKSIPTVTLASGKKISARRMLWARSKELLKLIPRHVNEFAPLFMGERDGVVVFSLESTAIIPRLVEMVASAEDLADFILVNGTDITEEQLNDEITLHDALSLIGAALEINVGNDLKNSCAGIGKTLSGLVSATPRKTSTAASTPTSAGTVSAPTT